MTSPPIPAPRLEELYNRTPLALFQCDKMGVGRRFYDTVVAKGTFTLAPGRLELAEEQAPVALADEPWDDAPPERASLRHAGEALLLKPSTDVLVTGTLRPATGEPLALWEAALTIRRSSATVLDHRAQVTGRRWWRRRGGEWTLTDPEPTAEVPIRYELAYGGAYLEPDAPADADGPRWVVHPPNPSGTGFVDERALASDSEVRAPQWQLPDHPVTAPNREIPLAGFGPVARPWSSRLKHAGTYDDAWERRTREDVARGLPADYPEDFDPRFFQCAHPGLITPEHLRGDEAFTLAGMVPGEAPLDFRLPCRRVEARLLDGQGEVQLVRMPLDTVHIDLDRAVVHLCWRLTLDQARDIRAALVFATEEP
ncbi:DUF2169 family type VI secretion system accessory protein [Chondromyces apiculatus]|uniref:DUF2169 domain-containing protein n=1 Tax=Chondromyces apiculatus DSM 436 TaxID=1192034 RepID=A0A017T818_9BACT|nr:DUF2169 domain-containing protein [Chondromyces apiculatus]EYF05389.1 Hypothetical protein CAP_3306 [Chondromyces apiculatus DSM 436]